MDVSIVIVNYNTFALTSQCIQSILDHTKGLAYEIILVDNNSTESDPEEFKKKFPSVLLVKNQTNLGFAKGNNAGIAHASGKYILLLNSDTLLKNNAVLICKTFLDQHHQVAAVSARLEYPDGNIQHNCQRFPGLRNKLFELLRLQKILPQKWGGKILLANFFSYDSVVYPDWIWGTFFMFRKSLLKSLPGEKLSEQFFMYVEDMQWCMEFKNLGYQIAFEPAAHVIHLSGKSGGNKSSQIQANTNAFLKQYYSSAKRYLLKILDRLLSN